MSELPVDRNGALVLLDEYVSQSNLKKHCLATEAIMRKLAERLGEDAELWGMIGLLHDLDFEKTKDSPAQHTIIATRLLEERGFSAGFTRTVRSHNEMAEGSERSRSVDYALTAAESVTGLIVAAALVRPEKENRLEFVKISSLKKRMKEKAFARNVNRNSVRESEKLGLDLEDFLGMSLAAMREISGDLGL